jgi:putative hydrolase of HD superfamily
MVSNLTPPDSTRKALPPSAAPSLSEALAKRGDETQRKDGAPGNSREPAKGEIPGNGEPRGGAGARGEDAAGRVSDFLFEAASLKRTPRTGYQFLGRGHESVAEHSFGAAMAAFALGRMAGSGADLGKVMAMALFHDLAEARTGDLNYVNKRYVAADEDAAFRDATSGLPFEEELASLWDEWRQGESLEARLAKDADQLDMILELKRLSSHGWSQAADWLFYAAKRLATAPGKALAERIMAKGPDEWWFERRDELWVNPKSPDPETLRRPPAARAPEPPGPKPPKLEPQSPAPQQPSFQEGQERQSRWPRERDAREDAPGAALEAPSPAKAPPP